MIPLIWNESTYQEFLKYLDSLKEDKYREFSRKLTFTKYTLLGVRIPQLKSIAKKISKKTNYEDFLKIVKNDTFEETLIEGQVIANIKESSKFTSYFKKYIKKIDDWSLCDTFCNSLKIVPLNESKYFKVACQLSLNKSEFVSRVGLVILLNYYVKEEYLDKIFLTLNSINSDKYYNNMAISWLICEIYVKFPDLTITYLKNNNLNKFTHNKAISKIRDSFKVTKEEKEFLNTLKRK